METQLAVTNTTPQQSLVVLGGADQAKARQIAMSLAKDPKDTTALLNCGAEVQKTISSSADVIIGQLRNKDSGDAGEVLTELLGKCRGVDTNSLASSVGKGVSKVPLFGKMFDKAAAFVAKYNKVEGEIKEIVQRMNKAKEKAISNIKVLDGVTGNNVQAFRDFEVLIYALQIRLEEVKEIVQQKSEVAKQSGNPMDAEEVQNWIGLQTRLERKIYDFNTAKTMIILKLPQIRLIQNNCLMQAEKFETSINITIPAWKDNIIIAIALFDSKKGAELQKNFTDANNDLLRRNAEALHQGTIAIAKENERGIVEISTLRKVTDELIATVTDQRQIQEEGKKLREQGLIEMEAMQKELKQKLLN